MSEVKAYLVRMDGEQQERIPLSGEELTIGKKRDQVDIPIEDDATVSRIHARLLYREGQYYLQDIESANGTYINGEKIPQGQAAPLNDMDIVNFARSKFTFLVSQEQPQAGKGTRLVSVYSPVGGAGATSFALAAGKILAARGKKVLYIGTGGIQSFHFDLGGSPFMEESLIRAITEGQENVVELLAENIVHGIFDFLRPTRLPAYACGLTLGHYNALIGLIREQGIYDVLLVDPGSELSLEKKTLLDASDAVLTPVLVDERELHKLYRFLSSFDYQSERRYVYFCNRYRGDSRQMSLVSQLQQTIGVSGFVMEDNWNGDNFMDKLQQNEAFLQAILRICQ